MSSFNIDQSGRKRGGGQFQKRSERDSFNQAGGVAAELFDFYSAPEAGRFEVGATLPAARTRFSIAGGMLQLHNAKRNQKKKHPRSTLKDRSQQTAI